MWPDIKLLPILYRTGNFQQDIRLKAQHTNHRQGCRNKQGNNRRNFTRDQNSGNNRNDQEPERNMKPLSQAICNSTASVPNSEEFINPTVVKIAKVISIDGTVVNIM